MNPPTRSQEPRRTDDQVVRTLASEALNEWLGTVSRRFVAWVAGSLVVTVALTSWAASAWATNTRRDVERNTQAIEVIRQEREQDRQALREAVSEMRTMTAALDSLRITIRERAR